VWINPPPLLTSTFILSQATTLNTKEIPSLFPGPLNIPTFQQRLHQLAILFHIPENQRKQNAQANQKEQGCSNFAGSQQ
jgi:hypothetical protein